MCWVGERSVCACWAEKESWAYNGCREEYYLQVREEEREARGGWKGGVGG